MSEKLKRDIFTKNILLSLEPVQWEKIKYIAKHNKKTLNQQLRILIDHVITVFEKHHGEIVIPKDEEPPVQ